MTWSPPASSMVAGECFAHRGAPVNSRLQPKAAAMCAAAALDARIVSLAGGDSVRQCIEADNSSTGHTIVSS